MGANIQPMLLANTPPVLSTGKRVIQEGWSFEWRQASGPVLTKPDGTIIRMSVKNFVPIIVEDPTAVVSESSAVPS